jgi:hypothetical protein
MYNEPLSYLCTFVLQEVSRLLFFSFNLSSRLLFDAIDFEISPFSTVSRKIPHHMDLTPYKKTHMIAKMKSSHYLIIHRHKILDLFLLFSTLLFTSLE